MKRFVQASLGVSLFWVASVAAQTAPPSASQPGPAPRSGQTPPAAQQPAPSLEQMTIPDLMTAALRTWAADRKEEAFSLLEVILKRDPANLEALVQKGDWYWEVSNAEKARAAWLAARNIETNNFRANLGLGRLYNVSRYPNQAVSYLEAAASVAPADRRGEALTELAKAYRGSTTGGATQAILTVEKALQAFLPEQDTFEAWVLLVALRAEVQDYERALSDSEKMLQIAMEQVEKKRSSQESLRRLNEAYETRGRLLISYIRIFMAPDPAGVSTDRPLPGREADVARIIRMVIDIKLRQTELQAILSDFPLVESAKRATGYDPTNPENWMTYGFLLTKTFQFELAAGAYLNAHKINPKDTRIKQEARNSLLTLLKLDPNNEVVRAELEKLDAGEAAAAPAQ